MSFSSLVVHFTTLTIWSLFISQLIKSVATSLHSVMFKDTYFSNSEKIIIFSTIGFVFSVLFGLIRKSKIIDNFLYRFFRKSINDDIFNDVIDYKKQTMMVVYPKNSDIYYIGRFLFREENKEDFWICLADYCFVNKDNHKISFNTNKVDTKSTLVFNTREVEKIQIIYEDDTELWERFTKE